MILVSVLVEFLPILIFVYIAHIVHILFIVLVLYFHSCYLLFYCFCLFYFFCQQNKKIKTYWLKGRETLVVYLGPKQIANNNVWPNSNFMIFYVLFCWNIYLSSPCRGFSDSRVNSVAPGKSMIQINVARKAYGWRPILASPNFPLISGP